MEIDDFSRKNLAPPNQMSMQDALNRNARKQSREFDALEQLINAYQGLPAVVDDHYPEARHRYETALRRFINTIHDNQRIK